MAMKRREMLQVMVVAPIMASTQPTAKRQLLSVERGDINFRVWLDGVEQERVISCKTGPNGWVQRYLPNSASRERLRGNVVARPMEPPK